MERGHRTESSGSLPEGLAGATSITRIGSSWPRCYVITPAPGIASGMMPMHLEHSDYVRSREKHRKLHLSPCRGSHSVRSGPADRLPRQPIYQLVTPSLVHGLLHLTGVASVAGAGNVGKGQAGSPASP